MSKTARISSERLVWKLNSKQTNRITFGLANMKNDPWAALGFNSRPFSDSSFMNHNVFDLAASG